MQQLLSSRDKEEHEKLESAKADREKGKNVSILCERYYEDHPRSASASWPCNDYMETDCILRDFLGKHDFAASKIREVAVKLGVDLAI